MNVASSRSHAIFTLLLRRRRPGSGVSRPAKFHLVDLAGSERNKRSGAEGARFKVPFVILSFRVSIYGFTDSFWGFMTPLWS